MSYVYLNNGFVEAYTCEVNIVHQCNLTCKGCSHLSPVMDKNFVDPANLHEVLSVLAKYYRADHVRLLGGEPLLHPNLNQVIEAVRHSGLSKKIRLVTNGLLLHKMNPLIWQNLDELHLSIYPNFKVSQEQLDSFYELANRYQVDLKVLHFNSFREPYAELGTKDDDLVNRIYRTCLLAHDWRCFTVEGEFFHKCPASVFLPKSLGFSHDIHVDGIKIEDRPDMAQMLWNYIQDESPLQSCRHCLGSVGKSYAHSIVKKRLWKSVQYATTEELLDQEFLTALEQGDDSAYGCTDEWEN